MIAHAHEGRSAAVCRARSRSARDLPQNLTGTKSPLLLCRTRQTSACHTVASLPGLPRNWGAPFSTLPKSLTKFRAFCGFMLGWVGLGREQKEVEGTKGS